MSKFDIKTTSCKTSQNDLMVIFKGLDSCRDELHHVRANIRSTISSRANIGPILGVMEEKISDHGRDVKAVSDTLEKAINTYSQTEQKLLQVQEHGKLPNTLAQQRVNDKNRDINRIISDLEDDLTRDERDYLVALLNIALSKLPGEDLPQIPSKKEHFNRNENMPAYKLPKTPQQALEWGWDDGVLSDCHQFDSPDKSNIKFVSPDGKNEVIFDSEGNMIISEEDYGTYNFANPNSDKMGHFFKDVIPWLIWGNSVNDKTTPEQRMEAFAIDGTISSIKKKLSAIVREEA